MAEENTLEPKKKEEKKQQVFLKLDWIFGIRKDIYPNVFTLDKDTLVYPASNYIVIYNHTKNMGPINYQHYIPGALDSKGITKIAVCTLSRKIIAFAEEFADGITFSFYNTTIRQGYKNFPSKQNAFSFKDSSFLRCLSLAFSSRKKIVNYIVALVQKANNSFAFVVWSWDLDNVRDAPFVVDVKIEEPNFEKMERESDVTSSDESGKEEKSMNFGGESKGRRADRGKRDMR